MHNSAMNNVKWCGALLLCSTLLYPDNQVSLLIVDTQGKDPYYYRNLISLADSAGFKTDYKNLYDLLEESSINHYDALFFMISPAMITTSLSPRFFNTLYCLFPSQPIHAIPQRCINALRSFAQQKHKAIGIILPGRINYTDSLKKHALHAAHSIGQFHQLPQEAQSMLSSFITYITNPDCHKGTLFGTALLNRSKQKLPPLSAQKTEIAAITPLHPERYSATAQKALPVGMLLYHKPLDNIYLVSKSSEFDFADLAEQFFKNPLAISHRNELLKAAQETLLAWRLSFQEKKLITQTPQVLLPDHLSLAHMQQEKQRIAAIHKHEINQKLYGWMLDKPIACAWFDPYDCFAHEDGQQKLSTLVEKHYKMDRSKHNIKPLVEGLALSRGLKIMYDGRFHFIWFEYIPEWYLSPHGIRKDQKNEYLARISKLSRELRLFFNKQKVPLPKIFIGMNLTSNFKSYPVANPVQSLLGTTYTKIPSPFDIAQFWKPEVLDMFDVFVAAFKNELPIDGVFFDFEMYHAQEQEGSYTDLMDFSDLAWKVYCTYANNKTALSIKTLKKRLDYLQEHKKFKHYFTILERASVDLGVAIKRHMRTLVPNLLFGGYAPTLPSSWFYRGIMAGLSSPSEPFILATFNTDYTSHYSWLAQHNIHLLHGTAIMLSKLHEPKDFNLITAQLTHHDFVWYNRSSRMIYQYNKDELKKVWWGTEATPTNVKQTMSGIRTHHLSL